MRSAVRRREKHSFRTVFGASFNRSAASSTVKRSRKNATLADGNSLLSVLIGMSHIIVRTKVVQSTKSGASVSSEEAREQLSFT